MDWGGGDIIGLNLFGGFQHSAGRNGVLIGGKGFWIMSRVEMSDGWPWMIVFVIDVSG